MDPAKLVVVALLLVVLLALMVFGPIFTIWSLNTIFGLQIPVNFQTWAAVIWLMTVFHGFKFQAKASH